MVQYQSFPGLDGASLSLQKLKALQLPDLAGRSFLDIGCNEGFFCGYASFQGATRSVGLDNSRLFIERARKRFPECEFFLRGWDVLPEGKFDVILLASALHYADDQAALLGRLVEQLSPDGVLVLELGIFSSNVQEWKKVERGIDTRVFPTMPMLREVLGSYAWKWMGPSVSQAGDPVPRHVIHVSRRRPLAYLMLEPPGYGKSTLAKGLFGRAGVPVVAGDEIIMQAAKDRRPAPELLHELLKQDFSPYQIDQTIRKVFEAGHGEDLVNLWLEESREKDFVLDVYVPAEYQGQVESHLSRAGFMPVWLRWERVGARLPSADDVIQRAEDYFLSLAETSRVVPASANDPQGGGPSTGFVDEVRIAGGRLLVRGWAITAAGTAPRLIEVKLGNDVRQVDSFERQPRPDVQKHLGLPHSLYGYLASVQLPSTEIDLNTVIDKVQVRVGDVPERMGQALPMSALLLRRERKR